MQIIIPVPGSLKSAGQILRTAIHAPLDSLPREGFVRAWCALAYLFPGLHPDGIGDSDNGWPRVMRRFVAEAWRRAEQGELSEEELYPSDATWAGLYDRMDRHTPEEIQRRAQLSPKEQA